MQQLFNNSGAEFSSCGKYRYALWRIWDEDLPKVMFIGLNPSTANQTQNDPTIRRVISMAKSWGFGGIYMMNCFPLVSAYPEVLEQYKTPEFSKHETNMNKFWLIDISHQCVEVIFCWGNFKIVRDLKKDFDLIKKFPNAKALLVNKNGSPRHPLYVKGNVKPTLYNLVDLKLYP